MTIGLGVISFNRPEYLQQCLYSLDKNSWGGATVRVVVIDEEHSPKYSWLDRYEQDNEDVIVWYKPNGGVASAKNKALNIMMDQGVTDFFLMEDDILMKSMFTCNEYAMYANYIGVEHMNFALHGPANFGHGALIEWKGKKVLAYPDCIGAFSYYSAECLDAVGLLDEKFKNAWEHVEHTMRICEAGLHPPFWSFVDHPRASDMLSEIPDSITNSSIRVRKDWAHNINEGQKYWVAKHGKFLPPRPQWPPTD